MGHLESARIAAQRGDYEGAIREARWMTFPWKAPDLRIEAHARIAISAQALGRDRLANRHFRKSARLGNQNAKFLQAWITNQDRLSRASSAKRGSWLATNWFHTLYPGNLEAIRRQAEFEYRDQHWGEVISLTSRVLDITPTDPVALGMRAVALRRSGEAESALEDLLSLPSRRWSRDPDVVLEAAKTAFVLGEFDLAQEVLDLLPSHPFLSSSGSEQVNHWRNLNRVFAETSQFSRGLAFFTRELFTEFDRFETLLFRIDSMQDLSLLNGLIRGTLVRRERSLRNRLQDAVHQSERSAEARGRIIKESQPKDAESEGPKDHLQTLELRIKGFRLSTSLLGGILHTGNLVNILTYLTSERRKLARRVVRWKLAAWSTAGLQVSITLFATLGLIHSVLNLFDEGGLLRWAMDEWRPGLWSKNNVALGLIWIGLLILIRSRAPGRITANRMKAVKNDMQTSLRAYVFQLLTCELELRIAQSLTPFPDEGHSDEELLGTALAANRHPTVRETAVDILIRIVEDRAILEAARAAITASADSSPFTELHTKLQRLSVAAGDSEPLPQVIENLRAIDESAQALSELRSLLRILSLNGSDTAVKAVLDHALTATSNDIVESWCIDTLKDWPTVDGPLAVIRWLEVCLKDGRFGAIRHLEGLPPSQEVVGSLADLASQSKPIAVIAAITAYLLKANSEDSYTAGRNLLQTTEGLVGQAAILHMGTHPTSAVALGRIAKDNSLPRSVRVAAAAKFAEIEQTEATEAIILELWETRGDSTFSQDHLHLIRALGAAATPRTLQILSEMFVRTDPTRLYPDPDPLLGLALAGHSGWARIREFTASSTLPRMLRNQARWALLAIGKGTNEDWTAFESELARRPRLEARSMLSRWTSIATAIESRHGEDWRLQCLERLQSSSRLSEEVARDVEFQVSRLRAALRFRTSTDP